MLRGIGNIGSPWVGSVCACKTPRIRPPASTSATPATSAKQARAPIKPDGRKVDDTAMPEFGDLEGSAPPSRETCLHVFACTSGVRTERWKKTARALLVPEGQSVPLRSQRQLELRFPYRSSVLVWVLGSLAIGGSRGCARTAPDGTAVLCGRVIWSRVSLARALGGGRF